MRPLLSYSRYTVPSSITLHTAMNERSGGTMIRNRRFVSDRPREVPARKCAVEQPSGRCQIRQDVAGKRIEHVAV